MADTDEIVVFEDSQGNEVSNDPRWHARRILGIQQENGIDPRDAELEELRAFKAAHDVAQAPNSITDEGVEDPDEDGAPDQENPYVDVKGADLSALAKERGIEVVKGMKAGDVRNALAAQDLGRASA
jgi:hypothetical protein